MHVNASNKTPSYTHVSPYMVLRVHPSSLDANLTACHSNACILYRQVIESPMSTLIYVALLWALSTS